MAVTYTAGPDELVLEFMPRIPSLVHLRDGASVQGRFALSTATTPGMMVGTYSVQRAGALVTFTLSPDKAYQPVEGDPWVRAYRFVSTLHLEAPTPRLDTHWEKKQIINDGLRVQVVD